MCQDIVQYSSEDPDADRKCCESDGKRKAEGSFWFEATNEKLDLTAIMLLGADY